MSIYKMNPDVSNYHLKLSGTEREICDKLYNTINHALPNAESKVWHGHPVWFIEGNPVVGYDRLKDSIRLLFWSGQSFDEAGLVPSGSFKAAEKRYTSIDQIDESELKAWIIKSRSIQWDYKNIIKRKGKLERLS